MDSSFFDHPLKTLGLDYELRLTLSGLMNVVQLVAVVFTFTWFEKMGRKTWLFIGSTGMFIAHLVVAGIIGQSSFDPHSIETPPG
jgi:hypothetical protein